MKKATKLRGFAEYREQFCGAGRVFDIETFEILIVFLSVGRPSVLTVFLSVPTLNHFFFGWFEISFSVCARQGLSERFHRNSNLMV